MNRKERQLAAEKRRNDLKSNWASRIQTLLKTQDWKSTRETIIREVDQEIQNNTKDKALYLQAWREFWKFFTEQCKQITEETSGTPE